VKEKMVQRAVTAISYKTFFHLDRIELKKVSLTCSHFGCFSLFVGFHSERNHVEKILD
jgi:hypothetical protein